MAPGEIMTEVRIPVPAPGTGYAYAKLKRKVGDFATAAAAVTLRMKGEHRPGRRDRAHQRRPPALKARAAEESLRGKALNDATIAEAARLAMSICDPVEDQRGDAEYKTAMAGEMTQRALRTARSRATPDRRRGDDMAKKQAVSFKLNGKPVDVLVEPRELLIHSLREKLQHTGPHIGCETSHCGACTVDLDGMSVKSCTVLTVQCQDTEMLTIEGFEEGGALRAVQEGFTSSTGCSAATAPRG